jgi:arylformamidase
VERVLFRTGARHAGAYRSLTPDGAAFLAGLGLVLVGTDAPSIDPAGDETLPAHRVLARAGVALLESLQLGRVPPGDYELVALPLRIVGGDASPVRAALRTLSARAR